VLIVGAGPEEQRLKTVAWELGVADLVEWRRSVSYDEMPAVYAQASALVLGSLPTVIWEEQFGMVLAEGLAAGLPIFAAASGAIPEVLAGSATLFDPGDWFGLAQRFADLTLRAPWRETRDELVQHYSTEAAARRLAAAYERVLSSR
jgi:glycosyltransferase involved in cell wall biosynthesis